MESTPDHDVITGFYDRHPYPPPVNDLDAYRERLDEPGRRHAEHHLVFPTRPFGKEFDLLVAGCGTSQAARHALRWPSARVVGIDVSATALDATEQLRRRYRLDNLELRRLPIERVAELGREFDLVVCTGVLHHLAEPDAGLLALRGVMEADGALNLMVYGRYGRLGVEMIRDYARLIGISTSVEEVRELAATIAEIPDGHPLAPLLRRSPDFRRADAFADALLNPRERSYTVPDVFALLAGAGLHFGRWFRQAPYRPQCGAVARTPHAAALQALPESGQYAAMELFRGTMVRHSLIAYRSEHMAAAWSAAAADPLDAIPVRVPEATTVEDRLPPGAAAVLINQAHTYPDLVLPVDAEEKRLIDALDGERTVRDLADAAAVPWERNEIVAFFEKLWWWDQAVFRLT